MYYCPLTIRGLPPESLVPMELIVESSRGLVQRQDYNTTISDVPMLVFTSFDDSDELEYVQGGHVRYAQVETYKKEGEEVVSTWEFIPTAETMQAVVTAITPPEQHFYYADISGEMEIL